MESLLSWSHRTTQIPTPPSSRKRKRGTDQAAVSATWTCPSRMNMSRLGGELLAAGAKIDDCSPRTTVLGHMQMLDLKEASLVSQLDRRKELRCGHMIEKGCGSSSGHDLKPNVQFPDQRRLSSPSHPSPMSPLLLPSSDQRRDQESQRDSPHGMWGSDEEITGAWSGPSGPCRRW